MRRMLCPNTDRFLAIASDATLQARVREAAGRFPTATLSIGNELRLAHAMASGAFKPELEMAPLEPAALGHMLRRSLLRPAVEPVLSALWHRLMAPSIEMVPVTTLASSLLGARAALRKRGEIGPQGPVEGVQMLFEPAERTAEWLPWINAALALPQGGLATPAALFAGTILFHPLIDGNGRLARALFQLGLARAFGLSAPSIPLTPIFYLLSPGLNKALLTLSRTGETADLKEALTGIVHTACDAVDWLDEELRGPPSARNRGPG